MLKASLVNAMIVVSESPTNLKCPISSIPFLTAKVASIIECVNSVYLNLSVFLLESWYIFIYKNGLSYL